MQSSARARKRAKSFVLEGERLIAAALASGCPPRYAIHHPNKNPPALKSIRESGKPCFAIHPSLLKKLSAVETSSGLLAVFPEIALPLPEKPKNILIMDAICEPGNLGVILRTAAGAAMEAVLLAPGCVDPYNPKTLRAGMGAHFRIPFRQLPWAEIAKYCDQLQVFLADAKGGQDYTQLEWGRKPWALILSNEAHGPSENAQQLTSQRLRIPLGNNSDSLNVAAAAAILLFEAKRQSAL